MVRAFSFKQIYTMLEKHLSVCLHRKFLLFKQNVQDRLCRRARYRGASVMTDSCNVFCANQSFQVNLSLRNPFRPRVIVLAQNNRIYSDASFFLGLPDRLSFATNGTENTILLYPTDMSLVAKNTTSEWDFPYCHTTPALPWPDSAWYQFRSAQIV